MATTTKQTSAIAKGVFQTVWDSITVSGDKGPFESGVQFPNKTIQVIGMPGATNDTRLVIEGGNVTSDIQTLRDENGNAMVFSEDGLAVVAGNPYYIRPRLDTVTSSATSPQVIMISQANLG